MYYFVLCGYFLLVFGHALGSPVCKDVKPVDNFIPAKFGHGDWLQLARYDNGHETVRKCLTYNFKTDTVKNTMFFKRLNTSEESLTFFEATGKLSNDKKAGDIVFVIKYGWPRKEIILPVTFTATDYDNYAIVYGCPYDEKRKSYIEYAWLLSKSKKLSGAVLAEVEEYLNNSKVLDSNKLVWNDFSDEACTL